MGKNYKKIAVVDGIRVLYSYNNVNNSTACSFGINCGALADKIMGTAHFLEHMLFYGTTTRSQEEIRKLQSELNIGAATSYDSMRISFRQSSRLIEKAFDVCSDMYFNSLITDENIDKERLVILQEICRSESNKSRQAGFKHKSTLKKVSRYAITPAGTEAEVKKINAKVLDDYKKKFYCKENFTVIICTNKPLGYIKKLVKKYIAPKLQSNPKCVDQSGFNLPFYSKTGVNVIESDKESCGVYFSFKHLDVDNYLKTTMIWTHIVRIVFGPARRMYDAFRIDNQISYVTPSDFTYKTSKEFMCGLYYEVSVKNVKKSIEVIKQQFDLLKKDGVTLEEYDTIRKEYLLLQDCELFNPKNEVFYMPVDYMLLGRLMSSKELKKAFTDVKYDEVNALCKEAFKPSCALLTVTGNVTKKDLPTVASLKSMFGVQ